MDALISIYLWCLLMGSVVGLLAGLLGIGGGLVMVPALVYLFMHQLDVSLSYAMPMAIATSLSTIIFTSFSASFTQYKLGNLNRFVLIYSGLGIAIGAIIGAQLATVIPGEWLKKLFAVLVLLIVLYMLFGKRVESKNQVNKVNLSSVGLGTGILSALMGIGGGAILVPALVWYKVNIRQAIGCASFCGLVIALFGSLSFIQAGWGHNELPQWSFGYVYLPATAGIVTLSMLTANYGVKLGQKLDTHILKKIFAGFLILVSLRMLLG
ncbi:sulfite exporter TauE/SafE family protein [Paraglaciecola hydrolytica]|uniref:Probable membrane transporter protein n=1 Tax=Paraglaciecola hydrolytica TaxID=1799789 RepID=A0A135ZZK3_9ALTE|nr:sulfite exporter TauE/SafE family protein [Paraglaciecola hydrolytica]KXI28330.1 permease [Paraglaciecola hydrolytica]